MKFEDLNTIWRQHAFEEPQPAGAGGIRKAGRRRFWTNLFRKEKALLTCALVAIGCLTALFLVRSLPIKAGLGLTLIVIGTALLTFAILRLAFRPAWPALSVRECALKDRKRMDAWIVALPWFFWINFAVVTVSAYDCASLTGQRTETVILMVYYVLLAVIMQITMVRRLRRNYMRGREALDRFLRELTGEDSCS
jgi:hypothetical protein